MALDPGARDCQRARHLRPLTMSVEVMVMHPRSGGPVLSRQQLDVLLNDISRGDKVAFEQLYRATSAKLYGIVLRIVRRREVADELLQDIYLRVWKHAGQFDALRSSPITWMATIARNCALDEVKRSALPLSEDDCELIERAGEDNPARPVRASGGRAQAAGMPWTIGAGEKRACRASLLLRNVPQGHR